MIQAVFKNPLLQALSYRLVKIPETGPAIIRDCVRET